MSSLRKIIHIDMDCFYAAVEMRDFPELSDKPLAIGGAANQRGVIATCNYAARAFGVRAAMPTAKALRLCPKLVLRPGRMEAYRQESQCIRALFAQYTPIIEPLSLDEAYLDVTHVSKCKGSATWIAQELRALIYETRRLTASAGIAPNKSLAKIASDWHKPNGQKVIRPEEVASFMVDLPVRKLFGVGPKMDGKLNALGIKTCGELQQMPMERLACYFGVMGQRLYELARGIDERPVNPERIRKSISVEETYLQDLPNIEVCFAAIPQLLSRLESRIARAGSPPIQTLFVKLKFNDFQQTTVEQVGDVLDLTILRQLAYEGYLRKQRPVRLLGLGVRLKLESNVDAIQLPLFVLRG
jgi:DNA polymerase-4